MEEPDRSGGERQPSEEELRAALEEQMRKVRVQDLLLQSVASIINLSARRIAKEDERDLEQAKVGIEAVRALVDLLPEDAAKEVRNALSELQMLYARAREGGGEGEGAPPHSAGEGERPEEGPGPAGGGGGGDEPPPSGLWTPRGSR
jgi:hypothetical protein